MQKLSLTKRPAKIGAGIPTRTERHGDDEVGALTIPIREIALFSKDICAIYNDPDAHSRLFTSERNKGVLEPAFTDTIMTITNKFKGAKVTLKTDTMEEALILKPATVENIVLTPQDAGGLVVMSCTIKGAPADDANVNVLHMLNRKCTIAILNGSVVVKSAKDQVDEAQGELPLDEGGPAPEEPDYAAADDEGQQTAAERDEEEGMSGIGRKVASSAAQKARKARKKKTLN
jgi:hypothetical protein